MGRERQTKGVRVEGEVVVFDSIRNDCYLAAKTDLCYYSAFKLVGMI